MGLTIHYSLHTVAPERADARRIIHRLRETALNLPFAEVDELVEFKDVQADFDMYSPDDPRRWLLIQAMHLLEHGTEYHVVRPSVVIAFRTWPGSGCEPTNFGLCRYPSEVEVDGQPVPTRCAGWRWQSFCKTQYASDPECGGIENFLRCHTTVVQLLDEAKRLGILAEVGDESGFWEDRDTKKLVRTIGQWNRHIAGFAGLFKDAFDGCIEAPITKYPNFEHLEADARLDEPGDA